MISLLNVAKYYQGQAHQQRALQNLENKINQLDPDLLADDSEFAVSWRDRPSPENLISTTGIGQARLGMSFGELKQALGDGYSFTERSPFIVDFDAMAVARGNETLFFIVYPAGFPLLDSDPIDLLMTDNPRCKTAEGIGPGTPLKRVEQLYGAVTLSFNTQTESRESVRVARPPARNIRLRPQAIAYAFAGDYDAPQATRNGTFSETPVYQDSAALSQIWVQSLGE